MECAEGFDNGNYKVNPPKGLKAFGRAYSAWALSPEWFRRETWKSGGYDSLEAYLQANWDLGFGFDGNDLLCLVDTWRTGNIAAYEQFGGDLPKALASIKAKVLVMPSRTDAYFPPEDSEFEVKHLKQGKLAVIESYWGHLAGGSRRRLCPYMIANVCQVVGIQRTRSSLTNSLQTCFRARQTFERFIRDNLAH